MSIAAAVNLFFKLGRTTAAKDAALKLLNRKRFTGELARKIKARSIKKGFMKESDELSKKTGLKVGERQRDYSDPDFIAKQKADRLAKPSTNLEKYNMEHQKDPTLTVEGGYEGLVKSGLGTPLRDDVASVKGILSMVRAAILRNPKNQEKILRAANLKKYNEQIQPHLAQLDDVERQIRYWLSEGDAKDVAKIRQLMTRYAELKKSVDPRYWHQRAMTWGHPGSLSTNVKNVQAKGPGMEFSEYLTTNPKALTRFDPEIGPLNIGKDPIDATVMASIRDPNIPVTRKGLDTISDLYKEAGVRSIMPSPTGKRMILGKHDLIKQIDYLMKALRKNKGAFEGLKKRDIQQMLTGYQAGGLVGLGSRILKKLAKKLSPQEFKMMMGQ